MMLLINREGHWDVLSIYLRSLEVVTGRGLRLSRQLLMNLNK